MNEKWKKYCKQHNTLNLLWTAVWKGNIMNFIMYTPTEDGGHIATVTQTKSPSPQTIYSLNAHPPLKLFVIWQYNSLTQDVWYWLVDDFKKLFSVEKEQNPRKICCKQ